MVGILKFSGRPRWKTLRYDGKCWIILTIVSILKPAHELGYVSGIDGAFENPRGIGWIPNQPPASNSASNHRTALVAPKTRHAFSGRADQLYHIGAYLLVLPHTGPGSLELLQEIMRPGSEAAMPDNKEEITHLLEKSWHMVDDTLNQWTVLEFNHSFEGQYEDKNFCCLTNGL